MTKPGIVRLRYEPRCDNGKKDDRPYFIENQSKFLFWRYWSVIKTHKTLQSATSMIERMSKGSVLPNGSTVLAQIKPSDLIYEEPTDQNTFDRIL